ncbi:MAG: ABC transporter ATP-binding protein [Syntrophales bacterium]|nr:ABC transporter ATP-binding protein [Syntrophales bacterium]
MLTVKNVNTFYGQLHALKNVSLHLKKGEIVTLIGANGAGKSTLINTISGLTPPRTGSILLDGFAIEKLPPHRIVELGISQVPEGRQIFNTLSVKENLELGAFLYLRKKGGRRLYEEMVEKIFHLFPVLRERCHQPAGTLSGGEQQMLAIGRALMARPQILLLDEPSMGLAPLIVKEIFSVIHALARQGGTTILLVEQNAKAALRIADRGYVLETGKVIMEGEALELMENKEVKRAYLGRDRKDIWER